MLWPKWTPKFYNSHSHQKWRRRSTGRLFGTMHCVDNSSLVSMSWRVCLFRNHKDRSNIAWTRTRVSGRSLLFVTWHTILRSWQNWGIDCSRERVRILLAGQRATLEIRKTKRGEKVDNSRPWQRRIHLSVKTKQWTSWCHLMFELLCTVFKILREAALSEIPCCWLKQPDGPWQINIRSWRTMNQWLSAPITQGSSQSQKWRDHC